MSTARKDLKLNMAQRDLVNFSVKAQDMILKQGIKAGGGFKTTDDLFNLSQKMINYSVAPGTNATTNLSQDDPSKLFQMQNRSHIQEIGDQLLLPSISTVRKGQQSPFKGFLDTSSVTQKMRQTAIAQRQLNAFELSNQKPGGNHNLQGDGLGAIFKMDFGTKPEKSVKMNPKVLETWINETLQDAEHLDIPGVILKPEHKNPISRYGIDRLVLTNAGIPNEMVDRIFRALFVYSVGFYELIKKCLQHSEKKYSIITSIWKVFSILLEYCCKTDYRMLISEISKENKDELDKLERDFQAKFQEQAMNERILKQNMEILQKYNEELEKDRTHERQMRLKLEEEYMQNTKNHEEEVQLRLKFESKLNNMHSVHRDLETKYKRALNELASLQNTNGQLTSKVNSYADEVTELKTIKAEQESKINYNEEKLSALQREINIKIRQVEDYEGRYSRTQDELDLTKYKLQESSKDITELKLKLDVNESTIEGHKNEKSHLQLELKETKELQKIYQSKCGKLMEEVNKVNLEFQESKREIIGFGEIQKEREDRIDKLRTELRELKMNHDSLDLKHGTLNIQHDKIKEQYDNQKKDLDDAIEKLHITNKVRHETEVKLYEEQEKAKNLVEIIRDKDEVLAKRATELDELDRRVIELERSNEALEIKKAGIERSYELTKKQLNEKITNLNDSLSSEKETREMWIERYEKEQRDHTTTNAQLLQIKSSLKDQVLSTKNAEIKLQTQTKANEVLTDSNLRLQDNLNEQLAKCENLERELNTQKEIMKQMDQAKKEYITKLKRELDNVESKFQVQIDHSQMIGEDYYSRARESFVALVIIEAKFKDLSKQFEEAGVTIGERNKKIEELEGNVRRLEMNLEDHETKIYNTQEDRNKIMGTLSLIKMKCENLEQVNQNLKVEAEQKVKYQGDFNDAVKQLNQLKKELSRHARHHSSQNQNQSNDSKHTGTEVFTQTIIMGSNLEQIMSNNGSLMSQDSGQNLRQDSNLNNSLGRTQGARIGGGGEIKKNIRQDKKSLVGNSTGPAQQFQIGGQQATITSKQSNASVTGGSNMQLNQLTSGRPAQIQDQAIPKPSQIGNYSQSVTNQQKKVLPFTNQNLQNQRAFDSQQPSPREFQSQQNEDTMASNGLKQSPVQGKAKHNQFADNQTMSSIMQSPQTSINHNPGKFMQVQQNSIQNEQPSTQLFGTDYNTIQSQQQNNFGQGINNEQYEGANVILEQQYEEDEERKTPMSSENRQRRSSMGSQNRSQLASGQSSHANRAVEYRGMPNVMKGNQISNLNTKTPLHVRQQIPQSMRNQTESQKGSGNQSMNQNYDLNQNEESEDQLNEQLNARMQHQPYQHYNNQAARKSGNGSNLDQAHQMNGQQITETIDVNSIESGYNNPANKSNRMKVDIMNVGGPIKSQLGNMSPQSVNSGYNQTNQQANFNLTQTSNNSQLNNNQLSSNRQMKGKSSIRTLIKSAATRE